MNALQYPREFAQEVLRLSRLPNYMKLALQTQKGRKRLVRYSKAYPDLTARLEAHFINEGKAIEAKDDRLLLSVQRDKSYITPSM